MAATGTPTPNIGLRIPLGTDPASVDDINYNSNLLDTKLGPVGSDSVQDQIDTLNGKIADLGFIVDLGSQTIASGVVIDLVVANLSEAKCVIPFQGNYSTGAQRQLNLTLLQSGGKWYCGVWNQSSSSVTARLMFYCIR